MFFAVVGLCWPARLQNLIVGIIGVRGGGGDFVAVTLGPAFSGHYKQLLQTGRFVQK